MPVPVMNSANGPPQITKSPAASSAPAVESTTDSTQTPSRSEIPTIRTVCGVCRVRSVRAG